VNLSELSDERARRVIALLEDAVADELRVTAGMAQIDLAEGQIQDLAAAVTSRLASAFSFDWSPHWVKPGSVPSWPSDDGYRSRCVVCLEDSPPQPDQELAVAWARDHAASHEG
jgi:hypothetical protein